MRLRFVEDQRTLFWAFVLFPLVPAIGFLRPSAAPWLLPVGLYLAYCAGVLTHNHIHCPVFVGRRVNELYSAWLSFFYGCPIFTWIPTHAANHHRYVNGELDDTRTTRHTTRNTFIALLTYPTRSARWQLASIVRYVRRSGARASARRRQVALQCAAVLAGHSALLGAAIYLHGPALGAVTYALTLGIPALYAPWSMMVTNYLQHVDCEPTSPDDHSRNFVSRWWNWWVFDAGYHTVHHEHAGTHWSRYRAMHERRATRIARHLSFATPLHYCFRTYVVDGVARAGADSNVTPPSAARDHTCS